MINIAVLMAYRQYHVQCEYISELGTWWSSGRTGTRKSWSCDCTSVT